MKFKVFRTFKRYTLREVSTEEYQVLKKVILDQTDVPYGSYVLGAHEVVFLSHPGDVMMSYDAREGEMTLEDVDFDYLRATLVDHINHAADKGLTHLTDDHFIALYRLWREIDQVVGEEW